MRYFFLALFILVSAAHLYGSYLDNKTIRNATKGGILLLLLGWYLTSANEVNPLVVAALLFSWLGDVLLIFKGGFAAGGVSFMISHVCFILTYLPNIRFSAVPWFVYALVAIVYGTAVFFVFRALKDYIPRPLYYPMMLYLIVNGAMNGAALLELISVPCLGSALVFVGAMLFFTSDSILFIVRFHKKELVWRRHFFVMLTYIFAEYLIVQGILLLAA